MMVSTAVLSGERGAPARLIARLGTPGMRSDALLVPAGPEAESLGESLLDEATMERCWSSNGRKGVEKDEEKLQEAEQGRRRLDSAREACLRSARAPRAAKLALPCWMIIRRVRAPKWFNDCRVSLFRCFPYSCRSVDRGSRRAHFQLRASEASAAKGWQYSTFGYAIQVD